MKLAEVIESLVGERGLDRDKVVEIVCDGIRAAYEKKYPKEAFQVIYNKKTGNTDVFIERVVVNAVEDESSEISLKKARSIVSTAVLDDLICVPFEEKVGRIEILTAKQVIANKIRELEQLAIFKEFKDKQGSVVSGTVHKSERAGLAVNLGEVTALLSRENFIPGEVLRVGYPIRALLKEVLPIAVGGYQLILDRSSAEFVKKLIALEIPEVYEGIVDVKRIVRIPGYKTKIAVVTNSNDIDPVGTCVGVGGVRIKPILKELGHEKIDLVAWTENIEQLVAASLKPAEIDKVEIYEAGKARVLLSEDQRSFAIGKLGQNIALAARLAGVEIQLQEAVRASATSFSDFEAREKASSEPSLDDEGDERN